MHSERSHGRVYAGTVAIDPAKPIAVFSHSDVRVDPAASPCLEANWIAWPGEGGFGVLITLDTLFSSAKFEAELTSQLVSLDVGVASLTVVASHSHNTPSLDPCKPLLGRCEPSYLADTAAAVARSIAGALDGGHGQPVTQIRFGSAEVPGSCFRRRRGFSLRKQWPYAGIDTQLAPNPSVDIPRTLRLWVFAKQDAGDGGTHFALVSWPCHPISRRSTRLISADFVAVIRQALRDRLSTDLPVLFAPGCCGDIRPDLRAALLTHPRRLLFPYPFQTSFARPGPEGEAAFDRGLTGAVTTALEYLQALPVRSGVIAVRGALALELILAEQDGGEMPVAGLDLWGVQVLGLGAEPSFYWTGALGWDAAAPDRLLTGYTGPVFGYLPMDRQIPQKGYEVEWFRRSFDLQGRYTSDIAVEPAVIDTCRNVLDRLEHDCSAGQENV